MKGKQRREEPMFACVRLEDLIPLGHILRKIDRWIDFSIIHEKTKDLYRVIPAGRRLIRKY